MAAKLSLLIAALSSPEPSHRMEAAEALAQLGAEARAAAMALVLASGDETEEVRQWAASALEDLGPPAPADAGQLASLLAAKSPEVGYWAATLLGRLKGEAAAAVDALDQALSRSPHLSVRQRAAWALGEIGPPAASALAGLRNAAADPDPRLARLASEAVERIGGR
jgi:HEAT repeat protein